MTQIKRENVFNFRKRTLSFANVAISLTLHFGIFYFLYTKAVNLYLTTPGIQKMNYQQLFAMSTKVQFIVAGVVHVFYISLYMFKIPFFEKFRSNNLPWSWETNDYKNFSLMKQIGLYLFNILVLYQIVLRIMSYLFKPAATYTSEEIPSFLATYLWYTGNVFL